MPKVLGPLLTVKHGDTVNDVAVSADGSTLMTSGNGDMVAQLWNATDGNRRGPPLMHPYSGVMFLSLSADGRYAVTGTGPGLPPPLMVNNKVFVGQNTLFPFMLWDSSDAASNGSKPRLTSPEALALSADGKDVVSLEWDKSLGTAWSRKHSLASGASTDTRLVPPKRNGMVRRPLFTPDLRYLGAGGGTDAKTGQLWFWDANTGDLVGERAFTERTWVDRDGARYVFRPDSHALAVPITTYSLTALPDGKFQQVFKEPRLQFLDVPSGRVLHEYELPDRLRSLAFSPGGDFLACVYFSSALELRSAETAEVRGPRATMNGVASAAFSGDGKRLFIGKTDGTAELWELDALLAPAKSAR
jgi:WD40 repeat protein